MKLKKGSMTKYIVCQRTQTSSKIIITKYYKQVKSRFIELAINLAACIAYVLKRAYLH